MKKNILLFVLLFFVKSAFAADSCRVGMFFFEEAHRFDIVYNSLTKEVLKSPLSKCDVLVKKSYGNDEQANWALEELRKYNPDLIVSFGDRATSKAKKIFKNKIIVFAAASYPEELGLLGKNVTGVKDDLSFDKAVQFFRLHFSNPSKIGVLFQEKNSVSELDIKKIANATKGTGLSVLAESYKKVENLGEVVSNMLEAGIEGIWFVRSDLMCRNTQSVLQDIQPFHIPVMSTTLVKFQNCAAMGFYSDYEAVGQRVASILKNILIKKKEVSEIPIYSVKSFKSAVNLSVARENQLDLHIDMISSSQLVRQ